MARKDRWTPVYEMDLEDGTHGCYEKDLGSHYVYCTQLSDDSWDVSLILKGTMTETTVANCKSLAAAKRWVTRNL